MLNRVFRITGNKIVAMLASEASFQLSSQHYTSPEEFRAAWEKKLSLATKVEVKYAAIKSVSKEDDSSDIFIKYKSALGFPTTCEFSFIEPAAYDIFFTFLQKERHFTRQHEQLTPFKAITSYLIGIVATLAFTAFCYSQALQIANGTMKEATTGKQELFNNLVGALGDRGVLAAGGLLLCYLGYKVWTRFSNPPHRLLFLPPAS